MEDDEIADFLVIGRHPAVIFVSQLGRAIGAGQEAEEIFQAAIDEVDRGRFERLDKPRGKPERQHVLVPRSEEQTSELQSLMRISYAVFCLKKKTDKIILTKHRPNQLHINNSNKLVTQQY